jgi:hypothetical protein
MLVETAAAVHLAERVGDLVLALAWM